MQIQLIDLQENLMPPLPAPPAPRPASAAQRLPFAATGPERVYAIDVPRYFIEVNVPGYDVDKAAARARRQKQRQQPAQRDDLPEAGPQSATGSKSVRRG
jgi:hypothetical protein